MQVYWTDGVALLPSSLRDPEVWHLGALGARREFTQTERVPGTVLNSHKPDAWKAKTEWWP